MIEPLLIAGIIGVAVSAAGLIGALIASKKDADANFSKNAGPGSAVVGCKKCTADTKLGREIDEAVAKCPAFANKVTALQAKGWSMEYGPAGKGSFCEKNAKKIVIDSNDKGNTAAVLKTLAHESGHAGYTPDAYVQPAGLTKDQYAARNANSALKDEGEATMTNIEMKACLEKNGGTKIGVAGAQAAKYEEIAKKFPDPKDRDKARQAIGDLFADGEHPSTAPALTYREYYEKPFRQFYDKLPPKKP